MDNTLLNDVCLMNSEQEILREEITSLQAVRGRLQQRISQLEEELKKTKEDIEKKNQATREEDEVLCCFPCIASCTVTPCTHPKQPPPFLTKLGWRACGFS